jgi:BNR repeat-like domain
MIIKRLASLSMLLCLSALLENGCSSVPQTIDTGPTNKSAAIRYSTSTFGLSELATFDVYVENAFIHILMGGKVSAKDKQIKLRYIRSEDGGSHWSDPVPLGNFPESINSRGNDIQLTAKGSKLLAVWQSKGELPGMGPLVSAYSLDNGKTWNLGTNPAVINAGDQSHTDLITDEHGNFHAIWLEDPQENGYQSLRYARSSDNGKHWGQALTLDDSTCSCCWNTFALSPKNELNILYRDMKPRDMSLLQSKDEGKTWKWVSTVGEFGWKFDGCPHVGGSLAYARISDTTQLHSLVWTGVEQHAGLYYLSTENNGVNWTTPQKLGNTAIHGDIAGLDGDLAAIWDEMEADGTSIFYAKSNNGGATWTTPRRLTKTSSAATHPRLVATKHGFLALWTEKPTKQTSRLAWQLLE